MSLEKQENLYDELRKEGTYDTQAPFLFSVADESKRLVDDEEVDDTEYLRAASQIFTNQVFHKEMALLSAELANTITKENYDGVTHALGYIRRLSLRFELLHNRLVEVGEESKSEKEESVEKSSSDLSGSLEYPVDLQI